MGQVGIIINVKDGVVDARIRNKHADHKDIALAMATLESFRLDQLYRFRKINIKGQKGGKK